MAGLLNKSVILILSNFFFCSKNTIKYYGIMINDKYLLTDKRINLTTNGLVLYNGYWRCAQCHSRRQTHFYKYLSTVLDKEIVYCRNCINMGRMDNITEIYIIESQNVMTPC